MRFRSLENHVYKLLRDPGASRVIDRADGPWRVDELSGEKYCLLTSFRKNGAPVATPVWFGLEGHRLYLRSEARDAKVSRIRRNPQVLVAPCTARGRPTGRPMRATARILRSAGEEATAERALRSSNGLARRIYGVVRAPWLNAAYIEVRRREPSG